MCILSTCSCVCTHAPVRLGAFPGEKQHLHKSTHPRKEHIHIKVMVTLKFNWMKQWVLLELLQENSNMGEGLLTGIRVAQK